MPTLFKPLGHGNENMSIFKKKILEDFISYISNFPLTNAVSLFFSGKKMLSASKLFLGNILVVPPCKKLKRNYLPTSKEHNNHDLCYTKISCQILPCTQ